MSDTALLGYLYCSTTPANRLLTRVALGVRAGRVPLDVLVAAGGARLSEAWAAASSPAALLLLASEVEPLAFRRAAVALARRIAAEDARFDRADAVVANQWLDRVAACAERPAPARRAQRDALEAKPRAAVSPRGGLAFRHLRDNVVAAVVCNDGKGLALQWSMVHYKLLDGHAAACAGIRRLLACPSLAACVAAAQGPAI